MTRAQEDPTMAEVADRPRLDCCCSYPRLTKGEINVLVAIAAGMTSKQAAAALLLSKRTVDGHVDAMRAKAGVGNRAELLAVAVSRAIIDMTAATPRWTGRSCLSPAKPTVAVLC
jgi:DNA-binding CsgD family transcriptional regulator